MEEYVENEARDACDASAATVEKSTASGPADCALVGVGGGKKPAGKSWSPQSN